MEVPAITFHLLDQSFSDFLVEVATCRALVRWEAGKRSELIYNSSMLGICLGAFLI